MRPFFTFLVVSTAAAVLFACPDTPPVTAVPSVPQVTIYEPGEDQEFVLGDRVDITGRISDTDSSMNQIELEITSNWDGTEDEDTDRTERPVDIADDGTFLLSWDDLEEGGHIITVTAMDQTGNTASDVVSIQIVPRSLPSVSITLPENNLEAFELGQVIDFCLLASFGISVSIVLPNTLQATIPSGGMKIDLNR